MPKLNHKHIVRYYSCWIEAVDPHIGTIKKALRQVHGYRRKIVIDNSSMESVCETTVKVIEDDNMSELSSPEKTPI